MRISNHGLGAVTAAIQEAVKTVRRAPETVSRQDRVTISSRDGGGEEAGTRPLTYGHLRHLAAREPANANAVLESLVGGGMPLDPQ